MKKRAISTLLVALAVVSFILPALATKSPEYEEPPAQAGKALGKAVEAVPEPSSFIYLNGAPKFLEYELRSGTTYVTVSSFVTMADPQAAVEEKDGVITVNSARVETVVDDEGNTSDEVRETLSMTVSTQIPYIVANGRYLYAKDCIITVNGHVAVPIRILAQVFNLDVDYDNVAQAVLLTHKKGSGAYLQSGDSYYDEDALYWLSRIIYQESGNQILEGKIAVGNVVMNRVADPMFPDNIYDVLNQPNQFSPASYLSAWTPNSESVVAAKLVLEGVEILPTALFFNTVGLYSYAARTRPYVTTIGGHEFYA